MSSQGDDFLQALRSTFLVEAEEHLQTIANALLKIEKSSAEDKADLISQAFRAAHSLKGAARATDYTQVESLCQSLEDMFTTWKRGGGLSRSGLDQGHHLLNTITAALLVSPAPLRSTTSVFTKTPATVRPASDPVRPDMVEPRPSAMADTVRISVAKLENRLMQAEEILSVKLTAGQRVAGLRDLAENLAAWKREWILVERETRVLREGLPSENEQLPAVAQGKVRLQEFFDWDHTHLKAIENRVAALIRAAEEDRHSTAKLVDDLLDDSKRLLLLPFSTLAAPFSKLVRDLSREQGKDAEAVIRGEDVEIDKRILEAMKDPLIHLLRNSVDHGIETPSRRAQSGKSAVATITLAASRVNGSKVELLVSDDGGGIDVAKVKEAAIRKGRVTAAEAGRMSDAALRELIFQPEISTSALITRVSGRGLGLAIVREQAERLGGSVSVESEIGRGARFRILLPAMLATFRGVLVGAAGQHFLIPTLQIERVGRVKPTDVQTVEGRETIAWDGRAVSLVRLDVLLGLAAGPAAPPADLPILVVGAGEQRVALAVDAILNEQEVLVKPLRKPLVRVRNVAGATVLGSGQLVAILNVADLLKSARKAGTGARISIPVAQPRKTQRILVAEDSITSRTMIKSILESAGYDVLTAVDGMEAFTLLRAETFDLAVSDVEMPRLSGFDLTARIRGDVKLSQLPVILITALETREDRERGIDVGASAYLVKSRFDQSDLLDTIRRLI